MKTKALIVLFSLLISGMLGINCRAQENDMIEKTKSQLFFYRTQNVLQSVDVQTDKTLYRQGEKIWFKGYVIDQLTRKLSLNSLIFHLLLADDEGNTVLSESFPLDNGRVKGCLPVPAELENGAFTLVAYTQEMTSGTPANAFFKTLNICSPENLNAIGDIGFGSELLGPARKEKAILKLMDIYGKATSGEKYVYSVMAGSKELVSGKGRTTADGTDEIVFFTPSADVVEPVILSVDLQQSSNNLTLKKQIPVASERINVSFFPEGGKFVAGIPQMVIFEAKDQLGNPVSLVADIVTEDGTFVTKAKTLKPGLGVFHILNNIDKKIKFLINSDLGGGQETVLPVPVKDAMAISVKKNNGENLSLMLASSPNSSVTKYNIVAVCAGEMVWASEFELDKAGFINIPLANFRHDIADLAVFDSNGKLVGERVAFVGKGSMPGMMAKADKDSYSAETKGEIKIKVTDGTGKPVRSELSITLADTTSMPFDKPFSRNIGQGLAKPLPENLTDRPEDRLTLDYYLIANNIKGLDWDKIVTVDPEKPAPFNQSLKRISGSVTGSDNQPIPNAMVSLASTSLQQFNGVSNEKGEFEINVPAGLDRKSLTASATDCNGKGNYQVTLSNSFQDELTIYIRNHPKLDRWGFLSEMKSYFESNPDFEKVRPANRAKTTTKSSSSYIQKYLEDGTSLLEVIKNIRPYQLMGGKIVFRGANSFLAQDGAMIVVDGQKQGTEASILNNISPRDVADIRILLDPVDMATYTSLNSIGVIEITLKGGDFKNASASQPGAKASKSDCEFVTVPIGNDKYKLITTLLWDPMVSTNENGEVTVPFNTGGIKSGYRLKVSGFTDQGEWVRTTENITVR